MTNIGLDAGFLNNKLTLTAEYFNSRTEDMILQRPIPISYGYDTPPTANVGTVENRGLELQLGYNKAEGDFTYNVSGNVSIIRNEVIDLGGTTIQSGDWYGDNLTKTYDQDSRSDTLMAGSRMEYFNRVRRYLRFNLMQNPATLNSRISMKTAS